VSTTPWRRIGEWRYSSTYSLTSALDGGEWSASRPGHFTPRERAPGTDWIGGWVGRRAVLNAVKRKIPSPRREKKQKGKRVQQYLYSSSLIQLRALSWISGSSYNLTHLLPSLESLSRPTLVRHLQLTSPVTVTRAQVW
jgi:hypothetical protein